jgi:hypothetical protein
MIPQKPKLDVRQHRLLYLKSTNWKANRSYSNHICLAQHESKHRSLKANSDYTTAQLNQGKLQLIELKQ